MKNKKLLSLFLLSTALVVGACNNNNSSSNDASSSTNTSDTSDSTGASNSSSTNGENSSSSSSSSSHEEESSSQAPVESVIKVIADTTKVTYECVEKAFTNDIVEIKVTAKEGYMITSVTCNGSQCSGSNGVYKFVMPNTSALVEITAVLVEIGDYYISDENGNAVANLVAGENGVFVAKNVSFDSKTAVAYSIKGQVLTVGEINISKTFANLDIRSTSSTNRGGFMVAGNATYDFYYDPANVTYPCYIIRTKVNSLPTSSSDVYNLFDGSVRSESTVHPQNLNHVEFKSSTDNEDYTWDLYSNNSSFATVKNLMGKEVAHVYKAQKDNVYEVIDDYTEAIFGSYSNYVERGDTTPYSGKYDIVDATEYGHRNYQRTQEDVDIDANSYSHGVESLYFDTYSAYNNGYVNNIMDDVDVIDGSFDPATMLPSTTNQKIKSEYVGTDGDFKVSVNYYVMWQNSSYYSESSAYITYEFDVTFDKAGAIKEGSYTEYHFTDAYFDFSSHTFKTNPGAVNPTRALSFKYGYGNPISGQPTFDTTPYYISSLSDVKYVGKGGKEATVSVSEELKNSEGKEGEYNHYGLSFTYLPETALDSWQYGISASSNRDAIYRKRADTPYEFVAIGFGTSTLTIDNHTANASSVKATYDVTVENVPFIISAYMNTSTCDAAYRHETIYANQGEVYAGKSYTVQMNATTKTHNTLTNHMGFEFSVKSGTFTNNNSTTTKLTNPEDYINLFYDDETGLLTFDLKKTVLPSDVKHLTLTISIDSKYTSEEIWRDSEIILYVKPGEEALETITGSWSAADSKFADEITFTDNASQTYTGYKTGVIKYYKDATNYNTYEFSYLYDSEKGTLIMKLDSIDNKAITVSEYEFKAKLFEDNQIGIYLVQSVWSGGEDSETTEIMGYTVSDDEGYDTVYYYDTYKKN